MHCFRIMDVLCNFFKIKVLSFILHTEIQNSLENVGGLEFSKNWFTFLLKNISLKKDIINKFKCHQQEREFMHYSLIIAVLFGNLINPLFDLSMSCMFIDKVYMFPNCCKLSKSVFDISIFYH